MTDTFTDQFERFKPVREYLTDVMNRLPFVTWDRLIVEDEHVCVYGWIARDDQRSDFVLFRIPLDPDGEGRGSSYTSSARFDGLIGDLLDPDGLARADRKPNPCWRVEGWMPDVIYKAKESE